MIRAAFENRPGRVIAASRIALALLFGLWVWIDPYQPVRGGIGGYLLLTAYVAYACAVFPLSWSDWWHDFRLGPVIFLIDGAIFLGALAYTEAGETDFVSAYFAFFTFLTLSCAMRWRWRTTLIAAFAFSAMYVLIGSHLASGSLTEFPAKYLRRGSYMVVISLIVAWFALRGNSPQIGKFELPLAGKGGSPYEAALAFAIRTTGASGAAMAWETFEEPGCTVHLAGSLIGSSRQLPPGEIDLGADTACLFDRGRHRLLRAEGDGRLTAVRDARGPAVAAYLGLADGLALPIHGATGRGQLVLIGIGGLGREYLPLGEALAREIAHGLDEEETASLAREATVGRLRGNIARDLHDSVAQSLAGAAYRISSLRQKIKRGENVLGEIDAIQESLSAEQAHIREVIAHLRSDAVNPGTRNLSGEIDRLLGFLGRQWQVAVQLEDGGEPVVIPVWLAFEIQQIVREGVANAVRHGEASEILVHCDRADNWLSLAISDNGRGFPEGPGMPRPQSIAERVAALGGRMDVGSIAGYTRIEISLPLGGRR